MLTLCMDIAYSFLFIYISEKYKIICHPIYHTQQTGKSVKAAIQNVFEDTDQQ